VGTPGRGMTATSPKHHYVPQSLLRQFSVKGAGKQVHVYDKLTNAAYPAAINKTACEGNFNTYLSAGERRSFEAYYQPYDDALAVILATLADARDLRALTGQQLDALSHIVAVQLTRTKLARTSVTAFAEQMRERLREEGLAADAVPIPTEEDVKRAAALTLNEHRGLVQALNTKDLLLIESPGPHFWLSDNPVVLFNTFPYGMVGVGSMGSEVYMPLTPTLCLAFYCPSIRRKIPSFLELPQSEEVRSRYQRLLYSFSCGVPVDLGPNQTEFVNECQVRSSHRFLYSASDDFAFALLVLSKNADLRDVRTLTTVGSMGQAMPRKPRMPMGTWAVFEGTLSHCMIPVLEWNRESEPLQFTTGFTAAGDELAACGQLESLTIYEDQAPTRGMRELAVDCHAKDACITVVVRHRDEGLNELMQKIRAR